MMNISSRLRYTAGAILLVLFGIFLSSQFLSTPSRVYADDGTPIVVSSGEFFVTIYDQGSSVTVKTPSATVAEILERSGIELSETDIVEPSLSSVVRSDYSINIYRARPAVVIDGTDRRYVMTASHDPRQVALESGLTVYDGDVISPEFNTSFLEAGVVSSYTIERHGGNTLTMEEAIPYETEIRYDQNLERGKSYLEQAGEDGRRVKVYAVKFEDGKEVSRELLSDDIKSAPVKEIVVEGAKFNIPPERQQCADWVLEAGVSPDNLETALELIYHESGCRIDATNPYSGAYGIPQSLPGGKMAAFGDDWETNPVTQIRWMDNYVTSRYGGWQQAMNWWWNNHWY